MADDSIDPGNRVPAKFVFTSIDGDDDDEEDDDKLTQNFHTNKIESA